MVIGISDRGRRVQGVVVLTCYGEWTIPILGIIGLHKLEIRDEGLHEGDFISLVRSHLLL